MGAADLVLPVASLLEHDGYVSNSNASQPGQFGSISKVIEPLGECKSDLQIMLDLHHRLYPDSTNEKFASIDNYINSEIAGIPGIGDTKYADLQERVIGQYELEYKKYELGMLRGDKQAGFNTPTGRIELWSTMLENLGDDPMPYYIEPKFSPKSRPDLVKEYPLILTTGARRFTSFHSENRQIDRLRDIHKYPTVEINPVAAGSLGITDGSWVYIENMFGRVKMIAHLTPIVKENVVSADHGWWLPEKDPENLYDVFEVNVGSLIPHEVNGPLGFGTHYKSMPCKVYPAEEGVE
jgi:anaerobic selenocysteine-containing dehydrogenase